MFDKPLKPSLTRLACLDQAMKKKPLNFALA